MPPIMLMTCTTNYPLECLIALKSPFVPQPPSSPQTTMKPTQNKTKNINLITLNFVIYSKKGKKNTIPSLPSHPLFESLHVFS